MKRRDFIKAMVAMVASCTLPSGGDEVGGATYIPQLITELLDSPASWSGYGGYLLRVNSAGTALELIEPKNPGVVDAVRDYGADRSGTNLSTNAFLNAIASGKHVFIPDGRYRVDDTLTLSTAGQQLFTSFMGFGFGNAPVVFEFESTTKNFIQLEGDSVGICGFEIEQQGTATAGAHIVIGDGTGPAAIRRPTVRCIRSTDPYIAIKSRTYAWAALIADLSIWNPLQYGIHVNTAIPYGGHVYSRIHIRGDGSAPAGIYADQADFNQFDNIIIGGSGGFSTAHILLDSSSNNVVQQMFNHIYLDHIPSGGCGFKFTDGGYTNRSHAIIGVNLNTATGCGAYIGADVEQVSIDDYNAPYITSDDDGIKVYGKNTSLNLIKIGNSDTGGSIATDGIVVNSGAVGTKITNSAIKDCRYAANLKSGCTYNTVVGNDFRGNYSGAMNIASGVRATSKIAYNNGASDYITSIASTPEFVGQEALVSGTWYRAIDTSSPSDWVALN